VEEKTFRIARHSRQAANRWQQFLEIITLISNIKMKINQNEK
jgi:hypothetical protein